MRKSNKDDKFAIRADSYDETLYRLKYIEEMAKSIIESLNLDKKMKILDFGAGTGLLTERLAPYAGEITAIDISESMISKLKSKANSLSCPINIIKKNLLEDKICKYAPFDAIVSTMTLHHIANLPELFSIFYNLLKNGASLAICDIDEEDGTFHTIDTGVKHNGFDRAELIKIARDAGFKSVNIKDSTIIKKPYGEYPAFILSAKK